MRYCAEKFFRRYFMQKISYFFLPYIGFILTACSSNQAIESVQPSTASSSYSAIAPAGKQSKNQYHIYWFDGDIDTPKTTSEHAYIYRNNGQMKLSYQTQWHWNKGKLMSLERNGFFFKKDGKSVPIHLLLRFSHEGEALYQKRVFNENTAVLNELEIEKRVQAAYQDLQLIQTQHKQHQSVYQGYWNGQALISCQGVVYSKVTYSAKADIPDSRQSPYYLTFVGQEDKNQNLSIDRILHFELTQDTTPQKSCTKKPDFS